MTTNAFDKTEIKNNINLIVHFLGVNFFKVETLQVKVLEYIFGIYMEGQRPNKQVVCTWLFLDSLIVRIDFFKL